MLELVKNWNKLKKLCEHVKRFVMQIANTTAKLD